MPSEATGPARRRLHPVSLVFALGAHARGFVVPALLVLVLSRGESWQRWMLVPFAGLVVVELVRYVSLTYVLGPQALVITQGLLSRRERHIPYARIQNIELVQNALHRLVGVGDVRLDTGAGEDAEGHLRVISLTAVDEIRSRVMAGRDQAEVPGTSPDVVLALGLRDLSLHGLVTARGTVVLAALAGLVWEFNLDTSDLIERLPYASAAWNMMGGFSRRLLVALGVLVAAVALVLRVLSAAWSVVRLYGFTLTRREDGLHSRYGLLTQVATTIPRARIQLLTVEDGPWHRWFGRTSVRVDTAGRFAKEQNVSAGSQILAPIVHRNRLEPLLGAIQPEVSLADADWQPIDPRTFRRLVPIRLLVVFLLTSAITIVAGWWAVAGGLALAAMLVWDAWASVRFTSYAVSGTAIFFRSGAWTRRLSVARFSRLQAVSLHCSPLDRRWGMAAVRVDTAGAPAFGHRIAIPWLPEATAQALYGELRRAVEPQDHRA